MSRSSWMATSQIGASSEVRTHLRRNASCKVFREACVCSSSDILSQVRLLAKTLAAKDCKYNRGAEQQLQSLGLSTLQGCRDRFDCGASFGALRVVVIRVCCFGFSHVRPARKNVCSFVFAHPPREAFRLLIVSMQCKATALGCVLHLGMQSGGGGVRDYFDLGNLWYRSWSAAPSWFLLSMFCSAC